MSTGFSSLKDLLKEAKIEKDKFISREFQDYGYRLAEELEDLEHKALYIKMAKEMPRAVLENARSFVKDAYGVKNKGKLFMWHVNKSRFKRANPVAAKDGLRDGR